MKPLYFALLLAFSTGAIAAPLEKRVISIAGKVVVPELSANSVIEMENSRMFRGKLTDFPSGVDVSGENIVGGKKEIVVNHQNGGEARGIVQGNDGSRPTRQPAVDQHVNNERPVLASPPAVEQPQPAAEQPQPVDSAVPPANNPRPAEDAVPVAANPEQGDAPVSAQPQPEEAAPEAESPRPVDESPLMTALPSPEVKVVTITAPAITVTTIAAPSPVIPKHSPKDKGLFISGDVTVSGDQKLSSVNIVNSQGFNDQPLIHQSSN
ncbi:uncharacterized protein VTP21DRAFT_11441 [Calcarisporiella thermophila]|uniref:uncharacterized protein n=1 Tax=Calcarisporiella thermophila TaxID=911321 RepID=UPI0037421AB6